jgi:type II secretory pathway pseudopilin PulG
MPAEYFKLLGIPEPPKTGDYFIGLTAYQRDRLKLDPDALQALYDQQSRATQRPWTAAEYPHLAGWLAANEKPLAVVVEATKRPGYFNPLVAPWTETGRGSLIGALLPSVQKCRELAAALTGRAMLRLSEGKVEAAGQDLLACHRLGRLIARGTMIELLVGIAIGQIAANAELAYLERADLTAAQLRDRLKMIQGLPPLPSMADTIDRAERYMFLDTIQLVRRGEFDVDGLPVGEPGRKMTAEEKQAWAALDWAPVVRRGNDWYDRMVAALRLKTRPERLKELEQIEGELSRLTKETRREPWFFDRFLGQKERGKLVVNRTGNILIGLLAPAIQKVQDAHDRAEQVQRNLQVAIALAAYRKDHGDYPATLAGLAPKYLTESPDDLFSGKGLVYRREGAGYLVYSVGVNGKDDGGRWQDDEPPGDDLRVRMPLPKLKPLKP